MGNYVDLIFVLHYTTFEPLGDRVLVEINDAEGNIAGGILLSRTVKRSRGEVVAVEEGMTVGLKQVEVDVKSSLSCYTESSRVSLGQLRSDAVVKSLTPSLYKS
ncbi:20 kDa chaperonin, chloroplastic-like protein [Tanacetum coccineum]